MSEVTRLLQALRAGDGDASDALIESVYGELRRLAASKLARERSQTLDATALVHEAWMRIAGNDERAPLGLEFENRAHFLGAAAEAMRRILIERARRRMSLKHGGAHTREAVEPDQLVALPTTVDVLALDEALKTLALEAPDKARVVELRFFGGLSIVEAAEVMGVSRATADRAWAIARAWLFKELQAHGPVDDADSQDATNENGPKKDPKQGRA